MDSAQNKLKGYFFFWIGVHLLGWSLLPLLTNQSLHLDTIEALVWGKEWQWGYDKHPPLSAWAAEIFGGALGDWGLYLLSQVCIVLAAAGIWQLGKDFKLSREVRMVGIILLDAVYFYQYVSPEFNVNYLQIPFWAWGWWAGLRGARTGKLGYWAVVGLAVGLGALTKYFAVLMVIPLLAAFWERGELWSQLKKPGLYFAGVISILVFLPHFLWMRENDWVTLTYGLRRAEGDELSWLVKRLVYALEFVAVQGGILLPLIGFAFLSRRREGPAVTVPKGLKGLCLGGYGLMLAMILIFGWKPVSMWAVPMPIAMGLWFAARWVDGGKPLRAAKLSLAFGLIGLCAYGIVYGTTPWFREKPHRVNYDGPLIAETAEELWAKSNKDEFSIVIADEFLGGIIAWYGEERPSVMIEGDLLKTAYLSDDDVREKGALVFWMKNRDSKNENQLTLDEVFPNLRERFPQLIEQEDALIPWPRRRDGKIGRYGVALIAPDKSTGIGQVPESSL